MLLQGFFFLDLNDYAFFIPTLFPDRAEHLGISNQPTPDSQTVPNRRYFAIDGRRHIAPAKIEDNNVPYRLTIRLLRRKLA